MAEFTAKDVQALRIATGAGMMDAKRALTESDGDTQGAMKWLRERGLGKAAERAGRETQEGAVAVSYDQAANAIALVQLRSETDFGAKSPDFVNLVNELAALVAAEGEDSVDQRKSAIEDLNIVFKENVQLGEVVRFEAAPGNLVDSYLHVQNDRGVNGVIVELSGGNQQLAHDIAVHIAFGKPKYLSRQDVPAAEVEAERATLEAGHSPGGQTRGGVAEDRRGQGQRLVQAGARRGPAGAAVRQGRQPDGCEKVWVKARIVRFSQVVIGG